MRPSARQAALLATECWSWLGDFMGNWYADPLGSSDGASVSADRVAAVGVPVPRAMTEWFELVGNRLEVVQDSPATPKSYCAGAGRPVVWTENQGVWAILAQGEGDDPTCVLDDPTAGVSPAAPLSAVVHGMLVSDTIVGASAEGGRGPLGRLAANVRGGAIMDATHEEAERLVNAFEELGLPGNPFWGNSPRGDRETLIRYGESGMGIEWVTATDRAFAQVKSLVDLDPLGGEHLVVVVFTEWTPQAERILIDPFGAPRIDGFQRSVGGLGHIGSAGGFAGRFEVRTTTTQPELTATALVAAIPDEILREAVVTTRPSRIATPRIIFARGEWC